MREESRIRIKSECKCSGVYVSAAPLLFLSRDLGSRASQQFLVSREKVSKPDVLTDVA